jgi:hypothetical protein
MGIYGDSIFDSYEVQFNEMLEHSKLFLSDDNDYLLEGTFTEALKNKLLALLDGIIKKIKEFLMWIKTKVRNFLRDSITRIKIMNLERKLENAKAKLKHYNESAIIKEEYSKNELESFLKTQVDSYRLPDSLDNTVKKVYNTKDIEISQDTTGDYILTVPGSGLRGEFIECIKNTVEVFVNKHKVYILALQHVEDKLLNTAAKLHDKLASLKSDYDKIKNLKEGETLSPSIKDEAVIVEDIKKINTVMRNHTSAINAINESINRMVIIASGIDHTLSAY